MNDKQIKVALGSLLHDVGKIVYRAGVQKNHSESGYDFLKDEISINDGDILDTVLYHHSQLLEKAEIHDNSIAYITYIADNIASASDRREAIDGKGGFSRNAPLESIFNLLNDNNKKLYYKPQTLENDDINYPQEERLCFDSDFYKRVKSKLCDILKTIDFENLSSKYINSVLEIMEGLLTYIPSSTSNKEVADISLFDHSKITSALSSCIYEYLKENNISDYKTTLLRNSKRFYEQKVFLMYSMDISGIQNFIYTINTDKALKTLRARSFYLEIFMETVIDEILLKAELSRANIIYNGGGHCYIILPNTQKVKNIVDNLEQELNQWLIESFGSKLYVAGGYAECSANDLQNKIDGSYSEIFKTMSRIISQKKMSRYSYNDIIKLNSSSFVGGRECKVCKNLINGKNERCDFCESLINISQRLMDNDEDEFFTIVSKDCNGVKLPFGQYLVIDTKDELIDRIKNNADYVRSYSKNKLYLGNNISTKLWVGSYHTEDRTDLLAKNSQGIDRIGVLRCDVDNLGYAFVNGFSRKDVGQRYVTLSRTATLSRQLSLFFKKHINSILENGEFSIYGEDKKRQALIVYSGGDDVFIIGEWDDVISLSVDISNRFREYTGGTLSLSAGIGVYDASYPISMSAKETEMLEQMSKDYPNKANPLKNAITIFDESGTYSWNDFENKVIGEKLYTLEQFFSKTENYGKKFLYNLLFYIRNCKDKINVARYVYLLSRMEPKDKTKVQEIENYNNFSQKLYSWISSEADRKQLTTAIYIYAYLHREKIKGE